MLERGGSFVDWAVRLRGSREVGVLAEGRERERESKRVELSIESDAFDRLNLRTWQSKSTSSCQSEWAPNFSQTHLSGRLDTSASGQSLAEWDGRDVPLPLPLPCWRQGQASGNTWPAPVVAIREPKLVTVLRTNWPATRSKPVCRPRCTSWDWRFYRPKFESWGKFLVARSRKAATRFGCRFTLIDKSNRLNGQEWAT